MNGTASRGEQSARAGGGWLAVAAIAAYAAAALAFGYALISVYWTLGGHGLLGTVGGAIERFARRGGITATLVGLATTVVKTTGGVLALALIRPWGRLVPRTWLLAAAAAASALLVIYGSAPVLVGSLVLAGAIHPAGGIDRSALRWHVGVWDLWFLLWGILLTLATVGYRRRTANADRG
jgi:hypothetical protein